MGFFVEGKKKEQLFAGLFKKTTYSSGQADMREHWDVQAEFKFDVKSLKRVSRSDAYTNENYHFVEIKNVHGKEGWLYGEADFFAFETNEFWVIVKKTELQEMIAKKVNKIKVNNPDEALYCLYQRAERKDLMTLVKTLDLIYIATEIAPKETDVIEHEAGDSIYPEKNTQNRVSKLFLK